MSSQGHMLHHHTCWGNRRGHETCSVNGKVWWGGHPPGSIRVLHVRSIRCKVQQESVCRYDTQLPVGGDRYMLLWCHFLFWLIIAAFTHEVEPENMWTLNTHTETISWSENMSGLDYLLLCEQASLDNVYTWFSTDCRDRTGISAHLRCSPHLTVTSLRQHMFTKATPSPTAPTFTYYTIPPEGWRCSGVLPVVLRSDVLVCLQSLGGIQFQAAGKRQHRVQIINQRVRLKTDLQQNHVVVLKHTMTSL